MNKQKVDILAIGVHPDDVELGCSATLLKHIDLGKTVAILDLTKGELGTRGSAATRKKEATKAMKLMGATARHNVGLKDGLFDHSSANIKKIIPFIRLMQPEIVLCNAIRDRHPDHGRSSKLVSDACFYAGLSKIKTSYKGKTQRNWRPKAVYHYIQDYNIEPDLVVNIDGYLQKKMQLIMCFKTQFYQPNAKGSQTPISSEDFIKFIEARARVHGRQIGSSFGEGFTVERYIGVNNLFDLQ